MGRAPTPPTAAEVLGELRDVFSAMDGDGDNDKESEGDALSADGPDEVFARDPAAAANRVYIPDQGQAVLGKCGQRVRAVRGVQAPGGRTRVHPKSRLSSTRVRALLRK